MLHGGVVPVAVVESKVAEVLRHTFKRILEEAATLAFLAITKEVSGIAVPELPEIVMAIWASGTIVFTATGIAAGIVPIVKLPV